MIHYHECRRCTHQWTSACFDHIGMNEKELKYRHRQMVSWICHDCFDLLEAGQIDGLEIFNLYEYLDRKSEQMGHSGRIDGEYIRHETYSGMCHPFISPTFNEDGSYKDRGNFESGVTAELKQLREIEGEVHDIYLEIIKAQRTPKRIELDEFQKSVGYRWLGPQSRPDGFEGDPSGKTRFQALFGLDPVSGDIIAPCIVMQDGTN
jgi:hypothetical protein